MANLWIFGEQTPQSVELNDRVVTIGRGKKNTVRVKDPTISKRHARLIKNQTGWWIEDIGSVNGTWIESDRVSRLRRLDQGTRFRLGQHEFSLDETVLEEDSRVDIEGRGTLFQTLPAMPDDSVERSTVPLDLSSGISSLVTAETPPTEQRQTLQTSPIEENETHASAVESLGERKLRLIRAVGEAVIDVTELSAVAQRILQILVDEIRADRAYLCLFSDGAVHGLPIATIGVNPGEKIVLSRAVCKEMLDNRAGVLIQRGDDDAPVSASLDAMAVNSTICVPLWTKDRIMGFMSMNSSQPIRSFTKTDLELLISVSHQAAIGVERARLMEAAARERKRFDYLCQYLDHKIVHSVLTSNEEEDPLVPKERTVTTMFSDIASFTKMSEGMDPTALATFVHDHFTAMTEILFANNGTVDKYIGDAVMALFGAPVADEKAAVYAVRAAIQMQRHADSYVSQQVRLRCGISTGTAVVGNIGSAQRREYTAIGDPVNIAARLQDFARPGEIVVDESTAKGLSDEFELEDIGEIDVRNRTEPVRVFQVELR